MLFQGKSHILSDQAWCVALLDPCVLAKRLACRAQKPWAQGQGHSTIYFHKNIVCCKQPRWEDANPNTLYKPWNVHIFRVINGQSIPHVKTWGTDNFVTYDITPASNHSSVQSVQTANPMNQQFTPYLKSINKHSYTMNSKQSWNDKVT